MPHLFDPLPLRSVTLRNRIGVSPMCQYSCDDGFATDWHLVHLGSRAVGGAALVVAEATAVEARGRISPQDLGLWKDEQLEPLARAARFIEAQGAIPGIQLAHAGRKGSTARPWNAPQGTVPPEQGGWQAVAPSASAFGRYAMPRALTAAEIAEIVRCFADSARRALEGGFKLVELHAAHGYLAHEFLSPLSNHRTDAHGGTFENRIRFLLEITRAVRAVWPEHLPLAVRVSATDWAEGGWTADDTVALSKRLRAEAVDLIDCSSGGNVPDAKIPVGPGYQVQFAERVRREAELKSAAVGLITSVKQADSIIREGKADLVFLAREMLRDPYFPLHAAKELGALGPVPPQYARAL